MDSPLATKHSSDVATLDESYATIWIVSAIPAARSRSPRVELRTGGKRRQLA